MRKTTTTAAAGNTSLKNADNFTACVESIDMKNIFPSICSFAFIM